MNWLIGAWPAIVISLAAAAFLWWLLHRTPADEADRAALIRMAEGVPEAEYIVRMTLAIPRLQKRHCLSAARRIRALVELKNDAQLVAQFNSRFDSQFDSEEPASYGPSYGPGTGLVDLPGPAGK